LVVIYALIEEIDSWEGLGTVAMQTKKEEYRRRANDILLKRGDDVPIAFTPTGAPSPTALVKTLLPFETDTNKI